MRLKYRWGVRHVRWLVVLLRHKLCLIDHKPDSVCEMYINQVKNGQA